jgi:Uma2 family endonuclease
MPERAEPRTQVGPYTWRDFIELEEDDPRELLDGHLVEIEVPTRTHERIVAALIALLTHWSWTSKAGEVLASGYKVRIDDRRGLMPDVQFYRRGNLPRRQERGLEQGRPDLAIEVISPSSRSKDGVRKLHDYAAIGVPEYWLLDPEARTLERLVLRDGIYAIVEATEGDALFRPDSCEGLEIDLGRLWRGLDDEDE